MRLKSLVIDNLRGIEHLELADIPTTGVIVISGPNEHGKTTIMDAVWLVLNEKHSTSKQYVRDMQPSGRDVGISVTLSATLGPYDFTIAKTFRRQPKSELVIHSPRRETLTGDQADARLAQMMREHLDADLAAALYLRQDNLAGGFDAAGIPTLEGALSSTSGEEAPEVATDDSALISAVDREFERYFTQGKQAPTGELKAARERLADARAARDDAHERADRLAGWVTQVSRRTAERDDAKRRLPDASAEVSRRQDEVASAERLEAAAAHAREQLRIAALELAQATGEVAARQELVRAIEQRRAGLEDLAATQAEASRRASEEEAAISHLLARRDEARARAEKAREEARRVRASVQCRRDRAELAALESRLADAERLDAHIAELTAARPAHPIDDARLRELEAAVADAELARRLRSARVPKLTITGPTGATVAVDDEPIPLEDDPIIVELAHGTRLTLGGFRAVFDAGAGSSDTTQSDVDKAERTLKRLLGDAGCETIDQAREVHDRGAEIERQLTVSRSQLAALLGGATIEGLRAERARLAAALGDAPADDAPDEPEDPDEAERRATDAEADLRAVERQVDQWRERPASVALTRAQEAHRLAASELAREEAVLASREATHPLNALVEAQHTAQAAHDRARETADVADAALRQSDAATSRQLLAAAQAQRDTLASRVSEAELDLASLASHIEQSTGAAEELDRAEAALESAQRQADSVERRAAAARRLREVLHAHRTEARRRYAQPFADRLGQLARAVFGSEVEFTLDDHLQIDTRRLGGLDLSLKWLSTGTKEQLAILTRFAVASLVSGDDGIPVPVFIDDALGSSDPVRVAAMATLFSRIGRDGQVFVLTCVPQRYERVVGKTEYSLDELLGAGRLL